MDVPGSQSGYNEHVLDHFQNPRNCGEMDDAHGVGTIRHGPCGDLIKLYIRLSDGRIESAQFKTYGCGVAIASSSALTVLLEGKTIDEARRVTSDDIIAFFGGVPPNKDVCTRFVEELVPLTIDNAIKNRTS